MHQDLLKVKSYHEFKQPYYATVSRTEILEFHSCIKYTAIVTLIALEYVIDWLVENTYSFS